MALIKKHTQYADDFLILHEHDIVCVNQFGRYFLYRVVNNSKEMKIFKDNGIFDFPDGFKPTLIRLSDSEDDQEYLLSSNNRNTQSGLRIVTVYRGSKKPKSVNNLLSLRRLCDSENMAASIYVKEVKVVWEDQDEDIDYTI